MLNSEIIHSKPAVSSIDMVVVASRTKHAESLAETLGNAGFRVKALSSGDAVASAMGDLGARTLVALGDVEIVETLALVREHRPLAAVIWCAAEPTSVVPARELFDLHVEETEFLAAPHVCVNAATAIRRLSIQMKTVREDAEHANANFQRVVDERTKEAMRPQERLMSLFNRIPAIVGGATVELRLQLAAEALITPSLYCECAILIPDNHNDVICGSAGLSIPEDRLGWYQSMLEALERTGSTRSVVHSEAGREAEARILSPLLDHDGKIIGLAVMHGVHGRDALEPEAVALTELFLSLTSHSIQQIRLEREIEESEALYRSLIDNVGDVIFRFERDGRLNFVSRHVSTLLGEPWRGLLGRSFFDLMIEPERSELLAVMPYLLEGHSHTRDVSLKRSDGSVVIAFVSFNPVTEHGRISGVLAVARDVTEKRRLERQIEESEQRYRAVSDNAYDAIVIIDPESFRIVDANPQMLSLIGYSRDELLQKTVFDLRSSEHADQVRDRITEVMSKGTGRFEDVPLIRKDGMVIFVDTAASVLELAGQRLYQAILRDISVQKAMTAELNTRLIDLQILVQVSDALQSSVDLTSVMAIVLSGVTAGQGLGFNRAFIMSYDKDRQELRGEAGVGPESAEEAGRIWTEIEAAQMSLPEMFEKTARRVADSVDSVGVFARKLIVDMSDDNNVFASAVESRDAVRVRPGGTDQVIPPEFRQHYQVDEFGIVPLVTREDVVGVLVVDNSISGRAIEEEDLSRLKIFANSAASAIERGRLLVSLERRLHELTLTNEKLKESRDRLLKTERLTAIGEVAASVAHEIRNPLAAIGGFARSVFGSLPEEDRNKTKLKIIVEETDRLDGILTSILDFTRPSVPRFGELDINGLLLQTLHFMDSEIDDQLITVRSELDPLMPQAWADAGQIRQVLLNIIRNAVHEMAGGGTLTLVTTLCEDLCRIVVSDTGPGIPKEKMDKIFEAFYTTRPTGSGLGLSISSQILRNHNGRLEVFSEPGEGASFVVSLPRAPKST